jgi:hypothetical protein
VHWLFSPRRRRARPSNGRSSPVTRSAPVAVRLVSLRDEATALFAKHMHTDVERLWEPTRRKPLIPSELRRRKVGRASAIAGDALSGYRVHRLDAAIDERLEEAVLPLREARLELGAMLERERRPTVAAVGVPADGALPAASTRPSRCRAAA